MLAAGAVGPFSSSQTCNAFQFFTRLLVSGRAESSSLVLKQLPSDDTNSFSAPVTYLLFFLLGLNDPAPAAVKETSENNQWSMFEVQRREFLKGREGGLLVWEVSGHALSPWRRMITHTSGGAAVPEGKSGLVPKSGIAVSEQSKHP